MRFIVLYFPHVVWLLRKCGGHGEKKIKRWNLVYSIQPKSMEGFGSSIFSQLFLTIYIDCSINVFPYCFVIFFVFHSILLSHLLSKFLFRIENDII